MPLTWKERVQKLTALLKVPQSSQLDSPDDDIDVVAQALEGFLASQKQRGKGSLVHEVESLRFGNKDLVAIGSLTKGQFGTVSAGSPF